MKGNAQKNPQEQKQFRRKQAFQWFAVEDCTTDTSIK